MTWKNILKAVGLTIVGYWGTWGNDTKLPKPNSANYNVSLVADKLKNSDYLRGYRGVSTCRICRERVGAGELTNYEYVFPSGLQHYVEEHEIELPNFLVESLMKEHTPSPELKSIKLANDNNLPPNVINQLAVMIDTPISNEWSAWLERTGLTNEEALEQYDLTPKEKAITRARMRK